MVDLVLKSGHVMPDASWAPYAELRDIEMAAILKASGGRTLKESRDGILRVCGQDSESGVSSLHEVDGQDDHNEGSTGTNGPWLEELDALLRELFSIDILTSSESCHSSMAPAPAFCYREWELPVGWGLSGEARGCLLQEQATTIEAGDHRLVGPVCGSSLTATALESEV
ncbi:hypothetical protein EDD16DRAFT_1515848 [Pisolithus croceorrhizus]|nr:hypothetical protein EV401DRAFT_2199501 [Pisolithus croceorrhizus]KAI6129308.1 hypothetical protein EDD16DRAFT_1515848 [Pisolithus croceorrhizus]